MSAGIDTGLLPISVALATYNGARFLQQQLESLRRQTLLPAELVVTDDGSTDETLEVVRRFAATAPFPVRVSPNETRLNFADNFLKAASLCESPLIAFCDQDDVWDEGKLAICAPFFMDADVSLAVHSASVWDGETSTGERFPNFSETRVYPLLELDPFQLVPGFAMVFRAELLRGQDNGSRLRHMLDAETTNGPMHHDSWIWLLASGLGKIATIAEPLALYRQHTTNTLGAPKEEQPFKKLLWALSDTNYSGMAELEAECASLFSRLSQSLPDSTWREAARQTSRMFTTRSADHGLRAGIYSRESHLMRRTSSFLRLLRSGAYSDDGQGHRLGRKAAVKDFSFGVPAIYRMVRSRA